MKQDEDDALAALDAELKQLKRIEMPDAVAWRIQAAARARRRQRRWFLAERGYDMALVAAVMLMALLPPAVGVWLLDQRSAEFTVLELPIVSTVRLAPLPELGGATIGGALLQAAQAPTAKLAVDGQAGRRLDALAQPLREGRRPAKASVHIDALVNAVPFAGPELAAEVGPSPWSSETRLLRVQVTARSAMEAASLEVAFHLDRVSSYRLLSAGAANAAAQGKLAAGESFVALFEVVPKVAIGQDVELATVRLQTKSEPVVSLAVRESHARFEAMPAAYRFAAAAAWFGLALQGEAAPRALDRVMVVASKALPRRPEAKSFLALVAQAQAAR